GDFTARINYANRFDTGGVQYEIESYPHISKTFYGYIGFGYSADTLVFPKLRGGASLFTRLPKAFETETGIRFLYFNENVLMYTIYVGKYYRNYLFGTRMFFVPSSTGTSSNYSILARYYWGGIDDYVGFIAGYGISPDNAETLPQFRSATKLKTYRVELM